MSADGKSVYVASNTSDAVARLNRNTTTGAISQPAGSAGCIRATGAAGLRRRPCGSTVRDSVAVSADGKSVYVASRTSDAVARLNRNTTTGAISQPAGSAGCISETGRRDLRRRPCARQRRTGWRSARTGGASTSPPHARTPWSRFDRNTTTGAISQPAGSAGCVSETGSGGTCADGHALDDAYSVAVSPDGKSVYVASSAPATPWRASTATRPPGRSPSPQGVAGCVSETGRGTLRRRPCAQRSVLGGGQPGREERLRRLAPQRRRGAPQPQHDNRGDRPARRDRRLHQRDGGGIVCRRPCAHRPRTRWRSARTGRAFTSPRSTAAPWRASTGLPERLNAAWISDCSAPSKPPGCGSRQPGAFPSSSRCVVIFVS